jgi:putative membrane protein insertion efficiency factor
MSRVARETVDGSDGSVARETPGTERRPGFFATLALLPIRGYRRFLSPALGQRCRYYPTCSAYAEESVRELGAFRGMILAAWRVLRCNPLSPGGLDPVSERTLFRNPTTHRHESLRENLK